MNYYYYCNSSKLINIAYSHITLYFYYIPLFYFIQQVLGKQSSPSTQTPKSRAFHSIGAKLSWGRWPTWVYALHLMRRKVYMCSSRNCLHYLASQQSILLQHSSIFYSLQTPTSYNSWWHTCPTLGYTTQCGASVSGRCISSLLGPTMMLRVSYFIIWIKYLVI